MRGLPVPGPRPPVAGGGGVSAQDVTNAIAAQAVLKSLVDAKGDLFVGSAADTVIRKAIGANGTSLVADSAATGGVKWAGGDTRLFDIRDFGAVVDGLRIADAAATAGQPTVSSASRPFVAGDVGKTIAVVGAGVTADGGVWLSTIQSVSGGVATLATNATTTVSGASCTFGTPDDTAVAAAQTAAAAYNTIAGTPGGTVYIPPGRTIVTQSLTCANYVAWAGENRETSIVCVLKDGGTWLTIANVNPATPLIGATFRNFKIEAGTHFRTGGYISQIKAFNISNMKRCIVREMWFEDTPATAIPCDYSQDQCVIAFNLVTNPGRMNGGSNPGGSGIGLGTLGTTNSEPTLVIGNHIIGVGASGGALGPGVNGIFMEAQAGSAATASTGYRVIGNYVRGMRNGILDAGSRGAVIQGNFVEANTISGIALTAGTIAAGLPGIDTLISGNTILNTSNTPSTEGTGILIDVSATGHTGMTTLRALITGNQIIGSYMAGVTVMMRTSVHVDGLVFTNNVVRSSGLSGMRVYYAASSGATLKNAKIRGNVFVNNGTRASGGDRGGIRFEVPLVDCTISANDLYDDQTTKTQTYALIFTAAATVTGGEIKNNGMRGNLTGAVNFLSTYSATTIIEGNAGYNGGGPTAVVVGASPFTYTAGAFPEDVYIDGGTVSDIKKGATTVYTTTGRMVSLAPGEALTITYSVAPTVVADKR